MAEQKALVTLKDGTKIEVKDLSELSKYSDRQDLDSISFFGDDESSFKAEEKVDTVKTVATVEQAKSDPVVKKPEPAADHSAAVTAIVGALAGAVSSAGMPALTNLAKSFIKNKFKAKNNKTPEEEKDEPTDCKTHQIKASAKFASISARVAALENKESSLLTANSNPLEDLEERIEKLEKQLKAKGKKK